jgi:accessory secretory protein Asp1
MIHFVPAWYNAARPWYSTDGAWFRSTTELESDDTVTQVRIFRQGQEATSLLVLNYSPSLRRFLHGQSLSAVPYWSFFDEVQGLEHDYARTLDFLTLEWPDDVSFFYNPFIVTVMRGTEVYARIYLAREGTLQSVHYYGDGMPTLHRIFDDRGFLSSVLMHDENGQPMTQYYLSRTGDVIVSEDVPTGRIDVVQNDDDRFQQPSYDSWEELMSEFVRKHLARHNSERDTVVLALAEQHNTLVTSALTDERLIVSRSVSATSAPTAELLARAGAVFTSVGHANAADGLDASDDWAYLPTLSVYPIERRAAFGASANEAGVYIALYADNLALEDLDYAIAMIAGQLVANEHTRLLVCSSRPQDIDHLTGIRRVIGGYQNLDLAFLADDTTELGIDIGIAEGPEEKIQLTFIDREVDLIRTLAKSRVLLDLGAGVSPRLAVEAVNLGVPQINRVQHAMVTPPINGYVIDDLGELGTALDHFLDGLEHWNQSLVQCRVLGDLFSAREVLNRWDLIKEAVA